MSVGHITHSMNLSALLKDKAEVPSGSDVTITGISEYSGDVSHGDVFLATSQLQHCKEAVANGAVAIVFDDTLDSSSVQMDTAIPMIACKHLSRCVRELAVIFYGSVTEEIKTIAITGTDGKSSVAHLTTQAIENCGDSCGMIGTLGYGRLFSLKEATHTTPPISRIAKEISLLVNANCKTVAIEASSHGIQQNRLKDVPIHTAVLTNITRDHLDYHKSVDEYIQAKAKLFFNHNPKYVVINLDDEIGEKWIKELTGLTNVVSFSLQNSHADIFATNINYKDNGIALALNVRDQEINIFVPILGEFNVSNILAVSAILVSLEKCNQEIMSALNKLVSVPGRMQLIANQNDIKVIIDYAHTPAALFAAINAVRKHGSGKLICVFGCGGDRDSGKRPLMGEVASEHTDAVVVTSDNSRNEDPQKIIQDILKGSVDDIKVTSIVDRKEAILYALEMANKTDSVLIAGKGHEKFQEVAGKKIPFDDVEIVEQEFARRANG